MKNRLPILREEILQAASSSGSEADRGDKQKVERFNILLAGFGYGVKELNKDKDTKNKLIGDRGMALEIEEMPKQQRMIPIVTHETPEELLKPGSIFSAYGMIKDRYNTFESIETRGDEIVTSISEGVDEREKELLFYHTPEVINEAKEGIINTLEEGEQ